MARVIIFSRADAHHKATMTISPVSLGDGQQTGGETLFEVCLSDSHETLADVIAVIIPVFPPRSLSASSAVLFGVAV